MGQDVFADAMIASLYQFLADGLATKVVKHKGGGIGFADVGVNACNKINGHGIFFQIIVFIELLLMSYCQIVIK